MSYQYGGNIGQGSSRNSYALPVRVSPHQPQYAQRGAGRSGTTFSSYQPPGQTFRMTTYPQKSPFKPPFNPSGSQTTPFRPPPRVFKAPLIPLPPGAMRLSSRPSHYQYSVSRFLNNGYQVPRWKHNGNANFGRLAHTRRVAPYNLPPKNIPAPKRTTYDDSDHGFQENKENRPNDTINQISGPEDDLEILEFITPSSKEKVVTSTPKPIVGPVNSQDPIIIQPGQTELVRQFGEFTCTVILSSNPAYQLYKRA